MTDFRTPAPRIEAGSNGAASGLGNGRPGPYPTLPLQSSPSLPLSPGRGSGLALIGVAVLLGLGALTLGTWAFVHQRRSASPPKPPPVDVAAPLRRAVALLVSPQSERISLAQSVGRLVLVLDPRGNGLLVVRNLGSPPPGLAYQAWVIPRSAAAVPAARFTGGNRVVWLRRGVGHGARVAVTLERAGARAPTRRLRLIARRP